MKRIASHGDTEGSRLRRNVLGCAHVRFTLTRLVAGRSCWTLRVLRWPGLTKSRRLLRPARLAHTRETWIASETTAQFDSVLPNECEASIKPTREAVSDTFSLLSNQLPACMGLGLDSNQQLPFIQ